MLAHVLNVGSTRTVAWCSQVPAGHCEHLCPWCWLACRWLARAGPQATFAAGAPGLHRATLAFHMGAITARARTPGSEAAGALALAARRGKFSAAALRSRTVTAVGFEPTPLRTGA